jgi:hypothetical protein
VGPNGNSIDAITVQQISGKVGIGIFSNSNWDGSYKLYVTGGIRTEKIRVDVAQDHGWADYVFSLEYKLKNLNELEIIN